MVRQQQGGGFRFRGMLRYFDDRISANMYHFHMGKYLTGGRKDEPGIWLSFESIGTRAKFVHGYCLNRNLYDTFNISQRFST